MKKETVKPLAEKRKYILKEWLIEEKLSLGRIDIPLKKVSYGQLRRLLEIVDDKNKEANQNLKEELKEKTSILHYEIDKAFEKHIGEIK